MPRFKEMPMCPSQTMLFGLSVEDALPGNDDVRAFSDVMDHLDYSKLESRCADLGCPPYPPKVMAKILGYAYSQGLRSSRKIEKLLCIDVRFIWLAGGLKPDHNTLARFRKDRWEELKGLFENSARLSAEAGLVFLNAVCTDGSKIQAATSRKRMYGERRLKREMDVVEKILREAEEADRAEDERYGSGTDCGIPPHLRDAKERKAKLDEIARRLKDEKKRVVVETEADSRVMKTSEGARPAYNLQASVDAENQIIVAMKLTQSENDHSLLPEMVEKTESNMGLSPDVCLGDTGYADDKTLKWLSETGHDALIPSQEPSRKPKREGLFANECFARDDERNVFVCPAGRDLLFRGEIKKGNSTYLRYATSSCKDCSFRNQCVGENGDRCAIEINIVAELRQRMKERLESEEGKLLYQLRQEVSEPVFGRIKENMGFRRFLLRGIEGATAESALACMAHNVLKCVVSASAMAYLYANKTPAGRLSAVFLALNRFIRWTGRQLVLSTGQYARAGYSF